MRLWRRTILLISASWNDVVVFFFIFFFIPDLCDIMSSDFVSFRTIKKTRFDGVALGVTATKSISKTAIECDYNQKCTMCYKQNESSINWQSVVKMLWKIESVFQAISTVIDEAHKSVFYLLFVRRIFHLANIHSLQFGRLIWHSMILLSKYHHYYLSRWIYPNID